MEIFFGDVQTGGLFGNTGGNVYFRIEDPNNVIQFGSPPEHTKIGDAIEVIAADDAKKTNFLDYLIQNREQETSNFKRMEPGWAFISKGTVYYRIDETNRAIDLNTGQWQNFTATTAVTPIAPKTIELALGIITR